MVSRQQFTASTCPAFGKANKKCVVKTDFMDALVEKFIDRINVQKCGTEHVRERIKVGVGKAKHTHTIRRVVHVRPKSQRTETNEASGRQIEWTHRWWRRGHWREIGGLGKDRSGNYCVTGKTWVMEHTAHRTASWWPKQGLWNNYQIFFGAIITRRPSPA